MSGPSIRTNMLGRQAWNYFNLKAAWTPTAANLPLSPVSNLAKISMLTFFFGIPISYISLVNKHLGEECKYQNEKGFSEAFIPKTGKDLVIYNEKFKDTPLHKHQITPYNNHMCIAPEVAFGHEFTFSPIEVTIKDANLKLIHLDEARGTAEYQIDPKYQLHRYMVAAPKEDYEAIKLKGLWRLAAAAYYQDRTPGYNIPLQKETEFKSEFDAFIEENKAQAYPYSSK